MFPAYASIRDDRERLTAAYVGVLQVVAPCLAATAGFIVLSEDIIRVTYGSRWMACVAPLRILALFGGFRAVGAINGYLYNAIGKPNVPFYTNLGKLLVIVVLLVPATRTFGLVGASLAVTIPLIAFYFIEVAILDRVGGISWRLTLATIGRALLKSIGMAVAVLVARMIAGPVGALGLVLLVLLGIGSYVLLNIKFISSIYREHLAKPPWLRRSPGLNHGVSLLQPRLLG